MAHTLTPRAEEERHEAGNHFSPPLYKVPGYKSLYLTPVSSLGTLGPLYHRCIGRMYPGAVCMCAHSHVCLLRLK